MMCIPGAMTCRIIGINIATYQQGVQRLAWTHAHIRQKPVTVPDEVDDLGCIWLYR